MKLSQKRTCNGCRSCYTMSRPFRVECQLGFKVKVGWMEGIPLEECYKPLTVGDSILAEEIVNRYEAN